MQAVRAATARRFWPPIQVARIWRRRPRALVALAALFLALLVADGLLSQVRLPVTITSDGAWLTVNVGGVIQRAPLRARIASVSIPARDPVIHEFQIDDTDSTNNFTLDAAYLHSIANTPYYRFYAWMRDLDALSRWRDVCVSGAQGGIPTCDAQPSLNGAKIMAPTTSAPQRVTASIERPETPLSMVITMSDDSHFTVVVDRNDRTVILSRAVGDLPDEEVSRAYFPVAAAPFAAMVAEFIVRVALWAIALLGLICGGEWLLGWLLGDFGANGSSTTKRRDWSYSRSSSRIVGWLLRQWTALIAAIHPIGLIALLISFAYLIWVALAQYAALPHIYDASAYLFGAKIYAQGRLWAPVPAAADRFNGPFMVAQNGKWFTQYEPGTSLMLAVGVALGAPWVVEPLLGTLSLLGIGLIAHRLYDRRVATLAVLLGVISPLYSYIAASYLSHAVAVFFLVWGFWALQRAMMDYSTPRSAWLLPLAGALWVMAAFTRQTSLVFVVISLTGLLWLAWVGDWPALRPHRLWRWATPAVVVVALVFVAMLAYFALNMALTGIAGATPRALFQPGDHWGFGQGVGFYGAHTLGSGFITVDELLTSLAIDLFGWPFYLTLALLLIPFLTRRVKPADVVMLLGACAMTFAFVGYFYAGIYLGPRYLYDALPFFLILTARGFIALAQMGAAARVHGAARRALRALPTSAIGAPAWAGALWLTTALAALLMVCWAGYFMPRQVALHTDFSGMSADKHVTPRLLINPPLHHAIVVTDDIQLYGYTLFAMNDPLLRGNVLYAFGDSSYDYAELAHAYPDRSLYVLSIDSDGSPTYTPIQPTSSP